MVQLKPQTASERRHDVDSQANISTLDDESILTHVENRLVNHPRYEPLDQTRIVAKWNEQSKTGKLHVIVPFIPNNVSTICFFQQKYYPIELLTFC